MRDPPQTHDGQGGLHLESADVGGTTQLAGERPADRL